MRSITASCPWKLAPKPGYELARQRAAKRNAQHEVEMLALEWSKIMLQRQIDDAINPATDPRLRRDLYNNVLNRGVGRPKPQEDEDAGGKKKGGNPAELLEMLAAISTVASAASALSHNEASAPRIERDIGGSCTDEGSLQSFLDDLSDDVEADDEQQLRRQPRRIRP